MPIHDAGDLFGSVGGVQMPARSGARSAGGANLGPLEATANGTFLPASYNLDGFDQVTVAVPPDYVKFVFSAESASDVLRVQQITPSDGTQIGETFFDAFDGRDGADPLATASGYLFFQFTPPGASPMSISMPVTVQRDTFGHTYTIFGGAFSAADNYACVSFTTTEESGGVLVVAGAAGSMGGMTIDTATLTQLWQTADTIRLRVYARAKSTT